MIFNTWLFALFGVCVFVLYWYVIPRSWRPTFLMVCGLVSYSASIPAYTPLILSLGAVTYGAIAWINRTPADGLRTRRLALTVGVIASVGVLVFFKYTKFLAATLGGICKGGCTHIVPDLIVPLAISFFTFEFVHILVDVYQGKITRVTFRDFWVFALFFPTMVAGPIKRFQNFAPQIDRTTTMRSLDQLVIASGVFRVVLGLAKKSIIADSMNPFIQPLLTPSPIYNWWDYAIATLAYTAKIYFDFTGYSDIAIGCSALLGYQILENFDRPYWSTNISDFWRRWHISLSSWIRDYIFIPLGGSHRGGILTFVNLGIVMALAGLWHGAAWHFVLWGLWHGAGLAIHRAWHAIFGKRLASMGRMLAPISIIGTFTYVALGWVLFASPTLQAGAVFAALLHL